METKKYVHSQLHRPEIRLEYFIAVDHCHLD